MDPIDDPPTRLAADDLRLAYDDRVVVDGPVGHRSPTGQITVIVGANACGKSTLLRGLARLLEAEGRQRAARRRGHPPAADHARSPPGSASCPSSRSRPTASPSPTSSPGAATRTSAGSASGPPTTRPPSPPPSPPPGPPTSPTAASTSSPAASASGCGSPWPSPRAPTLLLLDEPTTFLDLAHQVEVLDLLADLNEREGRTIVLVLHDLNLACRYAHHLVAMKDGAIVAEGPPAEVITAADRATTCSACAAR